jgi:hydroxymethylpyrimidine/phosphomethylpyrimidine kinase
VHVGAIKVGALGSGAIAGVVADVLGALDQYTPVVVDPIVNATSGAVLLDAEGVDIVRRRLLPLATVITPNLAEAGALLGRRPPTTRDELPEAADRLLDLGARAVLITGGHLGGPVSVDCFRDAGRSQELEEPRLPASAHGLGCALSSAIAVFLGDGLSTVAACERAKAYVTEALRAGGRLRIGSGRRLIDHSRSDGAS